MAYSPDHHEYHFMVAWWQQNKNNQSKAFVVVNQNKTDQENSSDMVLVPIYTTLTNTHTAFTVLICLVMCFGIIGNALVIHIFNKAKSFVNQETKKFEFLLKILGVVHLVTSIVAPSTMLYYTLTNYQAWHFGEVGCKLIPPVLQVSITLTYGILILISYEKYKSNCKPFGHQNMTRKQVMFWITGIIFVSIALSIPYSSTLEIFEDPFMVAHTCLPKPDSQRMQVVAVSLYLTRDVITILFLVYIHFRIHLVSRKQSMTVDECDHKKSGRQIIQIVTVVFLALTIPADIFHLSVLSTLTGVYEQTNADTFKTIISVNTFLQILQISSVIANFFIYTRHHSRFRSFFRLTKKNREGDDNPFHEISITKTNNKLVLKVTSYEDTDVSSCSSV